MKTLVWIVRHPLFAASWYLRGKPYSAAVVAALLVGGLLCAAPAAAQGFGALRGATGGSNPHTVFVVAGWHQRAAGLVAGEIALPLPGFDKGSSAEEGCVCVTIGGGVSASSHLKDYRYFTAGVAIQMRDGRFAFDVRGNILPGPSNEKPAATYGAEFGLTLYYVRASLAIQSGLHRYAVGLGVRAAIF